MDKSVDKVDNSAKRRIFAQDGPVVGLFAKQPVPGQVKTRLTPPLSAEQACRLYRCALEESVARFVARGLRLVICHAGDPAWFGAAFPGLPLLPQGEGGLGERLKRCAQALFAAGGAPVLLAGSDSPDLPAALLDEVLERLDRQDAALIPCADGGYALIGLRRPLPELFDDIPWSTPGVVEATRRRCRASGLSLHETTPWYDLDGPEDLRRLARRSPWSRTARHIGEALTGLLGPAPPAG